MYLLENGHAPVRGMHVMMMITMMYWTYLLYTNRVYCYKVNRLTDKS